MRDLHGELVLLRPIREEDADDLRRIVNHPEVSKWWKPGAPPWPLDKKEDCAKLSVLLEDRVVGLIYCCEHNHPEFRHASLDIFIDPEFHRQGLATDGLQTVINYLREQLGHHRITIDPALHNTAAIACYEKLGFHRVGVMHEYWRDHVSGEWKDGLLMELCSHSQRTAY
jgi:aminoglycoside 6'-N-acetyltransferase